MKKRFLALFLCCVMVFTLLPAALTTAFATGEADEEGTAPAQETTDVVPEDTGDLDDEQQPDDEQPAVCTCDAAEGAAHAEDCPLYVAPEQPADEQDKQDEQPAVCTCGAAEGAAHAEDCPLYVAPEQPTDEQDKQDEQPVVTKLVDSTALTAHRDHGGVRGHRRGDPGGAAESADGGAGRAGRGARGFADAGAAAPHRRYAV